MSGQADTETRIQGTFRSERHIAPGKGKHIHTYKEIIEYWREIAVIRSGQSLLNKVQGEVNVNK